MSDERDTRDAVPATAPVAPVGPPLRKRMTSRMLGGASVDYANARVRGRRAKLMRGVDYEPLLGASDLASLLAELSHSKYADDIERSMLSLTGAPIVGRATGDYFARELALVLKLYDAREGRSLLALAAMWDIEDLKTVVRSAYAGQPAAVTIASFRGGGVTIGHDELALLAREQSVEAVVSVASTLNLPYARALRDGAKRYAVSKTLSDLEAALDRQYAEWAAAELDAAPHGGGLAGDYLRRMIDVRNIMTAMRWLASGGIAVAGDGALAAGGRTSAKGRQQGAADTVGVPGEARDFVKGYFLPGGAEVDVSRFRRMLAAESVEAAIPVLAATPYARILRSVFGEYALSGSLAEYDRALSQRIVSDTVRTGKRDLLGMGVPVAYLLALEAEVANLRIIAHGKAFGIPNAMLSKELNVV